MVMIGNVKISTPLALAPMAGVNCRAFRILCKRAGAGLIYSQMINVDDFFGDKDAILERYADFSDEERPIAAQIIGANKESMAKAAAYLQQHADIIDINFGCCDRDQLKKEAGCYYIKDPARIHDTVKEIVSAVDVPVTAKIRIGWDEGSINCIETARAIEKAGASAIAVHARTKEQGFSGDAGWKYIKRVKQAVSIPVIGNGDARSPRRAKAMKEETGCDIVMIGRPAIGDPHLFARCRSFLEDETILHYQSSKERYDLFLEFLRLYKAQPRQKFSELRNHAMWFTKGLKGAKDMRDSILRCEDIPSILSLYEGLK